MDKTILDFRRDLKEHNDNYELLDEMYRYIKSISPDYYVNGRMLERFKNILIELRYAEKYMEERYICDVDVHYSKHEYFKNKHYNKISLLFSRPEDILDYIVFYTRSKLIGEVDIREHFNLIDMVNHCQQSAGYVNELCYQYLNLPFKSYRIDPGYDREIKLFGGGGYHYFNIVTIKDKKYIIDCTYKQFFKASNNSLEKLGIPEIRTPYVGVFMTVDEKRKELAEQLLKRGWVEATDENLKMYLDAFTISFRNGLYYESLDELKYETEYTVQDYEKFLDGKDYQLRHEELEVLGLQHKPLKNTKFNFKV